MRKKESSYPLSSFWTQQGSHTIESRAFTWKGSGGGNRGFRVLHLAGLPVFVFLSIIDSSTVFPYKPLSNKAPGNKPMCLLLSVHQGLQSYSSS